MSLREDACPMSGASIPQRSFFRCPSISRLVFRRGDVLDMGLKYPPRVLGWVATSAGGVGATDQSS